MPRRSTVQDPEPILVTPHPLLTAPPTAVTFPLVTRSLPAPHQRQKQFSQRPLSQGKIMTPWLSGYMNKPDEEGEPQHESLTVRLCTDVTSAPLLGLHFPTGI